VPEFTTSDGCRLHFSEAGSGRPLVLIHGWAQSAELFKHQISALSQRCRVVAPDLRGHGLSEEPGHGYRLARLAKDLFELLAALDLREVNLLGWSMGCAVIWSYWDLFGPRRLARLILVDESPRLLKSPGDDLGYRGLDEAADICRRLRQEQPELVKWFVEGMLTIEASPAEKDWLLEINLKLPGARSAALYFDLAAFDGRDVIPRISLPTLIIGGGKSHIPRSSQVWLREHIPGSRLEILEDFGHLMFYEAPERFNELVAGFIG